MQFGVPHLAICSGRSDDSAGRPTYSAKSNIFCASGGYYDKCGELATHNARQIAHFRVRREHFLAVANHPNDTAAEHAAAEVFKYSFAAGAYVSFQHLPTKAAVDVCALTLGSGSNQQHFLAVVNHHTFGLCVLLRFSKIFQFYLHRLQYSFIYIALINRSVDVE